MNIQETDLFVRNVHFLKLRIGNYIDIKKYLVYPKVKIYFHILLSEI